MPTVFAKLNLKDQTEILVVNAPASFESELKTLENLTVFRDAGKMKKIAFALAFVTRQKELDTISKQLATKAEGDVILWFAYPKGTSKRYQCEFNRDSGWEVIRGCGFDSVRMVAIDEDWSALRFRRVENIGSPASRSKQT